MYIICVLDLKVSCIYNKKQDDKILGNKRQAKKDKGDINENGF